MYKRNELIGIGLIAFGCLLLLAKIGILRTGWEVFWPIFILLPGIIMEIAYFYDNNLSGLLVPGGILTIVGIIFFICSIFNWGLMSVLWPLFPFSVAFGLFQLYIFGEREKGLLIPVGILGLGSMVALVINFASAAAGEILPILLIIAGGYFYYRSRRNLKSNI